MKTSSWYFYKIQMRSLVRLLEPIHLFSRLLLNACYVLTVHGSWTKFLKVLSGWGSSKKKDFEAK